MSLPQQLEQHSYQPDLGALPRKYGRKLVAALSAVNGSVKSQIMNVTNRLTFALADFLAAAPSHCQSTNTDSCEIEQTNEAQQNHLTWA